MEQSDHAHAHATIWEKLESVCGKTRIIDWLRVILLLGIRFRSGFSRQCKYLSNKNIQLSYSEARTFKTPLIWVHAVIWTWKKIFCKNSMKNTMCQAKLTQSIIFCSEKWTINGLVCMSDVSAQRIEPTLTRIIPLLLASGRIPSRDFSTLVEAGSPFPS